MESKDGFYHLGIAQLIISTGLPNVKLSSMIDVEPSAISSWKGGFTAPRFYSFMDLITVTKSNANQVLTGKAQGKWIQGYEKKSYMDRLAAVWKQFVGCGSTSTALYAVHMTKRALDELMDGDDVPIKRFYNFCIVTGYDAHWLMYGKVY